MPVGSFSFKKLSDFTPVFHDPVRLRSAHGNVTLPMIFAGIPSDIPVLAECVDGINIKLVKCGGLLEAYRMISVARAHGLSVMLGCMIESSLGITAAAKRSQ